MLFEVDAFEFVAHDGGADFGGGLAQFGLLIGEEAFFGASGALRAVHGFKATAQAGVAKGAVAAAIAGELIGHAAHLGDLLVDMQLPWIAGIRSGEQRGSEDGRKSADLERSGGMIGGHVVGGVCPLGIAGGGEDKDCGGGEIAIAK